MIPTSPPTVPSPDAHEGAGSPNAPVRPAGSGSRVAGVAVLGLVLSACAPAPTSLGEVRGGLRLDVEIVDLPQGLTLTSATLHADAITLDNCSGDRLMIPVDLPLDALGPSPEPPWMRPGGYCSAGILIGGSGALTLSGTLDGAPLSVDLDLGGIVSVHPFIVLEHDVILAVSLDRLDLQALGRGDGAAAWPGPWPAPAVPWADLDGDGRIGPGDEPLDTLRR